MSYSYQAIYDAVRSKIRAGDIAEAVSDIARGAFDISWTRSIAEQEIYAVSHELQRPSVVYKPALYPDGDMWCALLGENLMEGVCGFGKTPDEAMREFDEAFLKGQTPAANLRAKGEAQEKK